MKVWKKPVIKTMSANQIAAYIKAAARSYGCNKYFLK